MYSSKRKMLVFVYEWCQKQHPLTSVEDVEVKEMAKRALKLDHTYAKPPLPGFPADVPDGVYRKYGLKLQDHLHIKKEVEEPWENLEVKQEMDIMAVTVKNEDEEEEAQCSLLHWRQSEENIKAEPATCSSAKLMKVEPNGDMSEGPEAANTCRQQDTDGEETDCSDTEDSEDWREPLSQSEAQSSESSESCKSFQLSENITKEKRCGCEVCGKQFPSITHLNVHMRVHTGEKPCCDICGKTFTRKARLKRHMRVHTRDKPFCCDVCGKRFGYRPYLKVHMRIHTGEKPFNCDFCGKSFSRNESLRRHVFVHLGRKVNPVIVSSRSDVCELHNL